MWNGGSFTVGWATSRKTLPAIWLEARSCGKIDSGTLTAWKSRRPAIFHRASCIEALPQLSAHWRLLLNDIDIESRFIDLGPFFPSSSSPFFNDLWNSQRLEIIFARLLINRYYFRTRKLLFRKLKLCLTAERSSFLFLLSPNSKNLDVGHYSLTFDRYYFRVKTIYLYAKFIRALFYAHQQQATEIDRLYSLLMLLVDIDWYYFYIKIIFTLTLFQSILTKILLFDR